MLKKCCIFVYILVLVARVERQSVKITSDLDLRQ